MGDEGHGHRVDSRRRVLSSLPTHLLSLKAPVPNASPACLPLLRLESIVFVWRREARRLNSRMKKNPRNPDGGTICLKGSPAVG